MTSREIFNEYGKPMDEKTRERAEEAARRRFVEQSKADQEPLNEFLGQIDFEVLRQVFEDYLRDLGVDTDNLNFLGPDRIFATGEFYNKEKLAGTYSAATNLIVLNLESKHEQQPTTNLALLNTLCHEEVHATAKVECRIVNYHLSTEGEFVSVVASKGVTGYSKTSREVGGEWEDFYRWINEAFTEKLARELMEKYIRKSSFVTEEDLALYKEKIIKEQKFISERFRSALNFMEIFLFALERETGVSRDVIWGALVKGMFEEDSLDDAELAQAFEESFGAGFLKKLKHANAQDLEDLAVALISGDKVEERKGFLKRFVEKLNI